MPLTDLADVLPSSTLRGNGAVEIRGVELDSRKARRGDLFACLVGQLSDGHDFAAAAIAQGAAALLVQRVLPEIDAPQLQVADTRLAMARVAAQLAGHPSREMKVVGVTGTNGKTTVTHVLASIVAAADLRGEVMGTLGSGANDRYQATGFTTPEAPTTQKLLREAVDRGVEWMAMEVSSHALAQHRTFATDFAAVAFTNLSRDHLDYHHTMESYLAAKARLFTTETRGSAAKTVAVINLEDPAGAELARAADGPVATYGFGGGVAYRARRVRIGPRNTVFQLVTPRGRAEIKTRLLGGFNVLNVLAAVAVALELGLSLNAAVAGVERLARVPGRMEAITGSQPFLVLVDYAHTPDALAQALEASRVFTSGKLRVVFGCGGERDQGKRPEMGRVAALGADAVVITSDNPRGEDPLHIVEAVAEGAREAGGNPVMEPDRAAAISQALRSAKPGDTVLIAGKGHEQTQTVSGETVAFDDRKTAVQVLKEIGFHVDDANSHV